MIDNAKGADVVSQRKTCIACGFLIPAAAVLCSECSSYQSSWRNSIRYFASVGGIFIVVITLVTYLASIFPTARKAIMWRDKVSVVSFDSEKRIVFSNRGDGPVFLSHMDIVTTRDGDEFFRFLISINKQLENGEFLSFDYKNQHKEIQNSFFVESEDNNDLSIYLYHAVDRSNKCVKLVFFIVDDPHYIQVSQFLDHLLVYEEVDVSLTYYTVLGEKVEKIPVVATFVHSRSQECVS